MNGDTERFHAVSLSGGKDSTAMLLLMIERGMPIDTVLTADTGMEFPEMYAHLDKLDGYLYAERGIHLTRLRHPHGYEWLKSKSYAEWKAEQDDRPTLRGTIRQDIDTAILSSTSQRAFINALAAKGYEFKFTGEDGKPLKYPGLKPPGAKSFFRFNKLGQGYSLEDIEARLTGKYTRSTPYPKKEREEVRQERKANQPPYARRVSGLRALYLRYCYELHIIVKHPASAKRVSIFMREDLAKLSRLDAQTRFLANQGIETGEQLSGHRAKAKKEIAALLEERQALNRDIRRLFRDGDEVGTTPLIERRMLINARLKELRKEVTLCDSIAERTAETREELERFIEEQEIEERRNEKNELLR